MLSGKMDIKDNSESKDLYFGIEIAQEQPESKTNQVDNNANCGSEGENLVSLRPTTAADPDNLKNNSGIQSQRSNLTEEEIDL